MKTYSLLMAGVLTVVMVSSCSPLPGGLAPPLNLSSELILMANEPQAVEIVNPNIRSEVPLSIYEDSIQISGFRRYIYYYAQFTNNFSHAITNVLTDHLKNNGTMPIYILIDSNASTNRERSDGASSPIQYSLGESKVQEVHEKFQELTEMEFFEYESRKYPYLDSGIATTIFAEEIPTLENGNILDSYTDLVYESTNEVPVSERIQAYRERYIDIFCEGEATNCEYITVIYPGETKRIAPQFVVDGYLSLDID